MSKHPAKDSEERFRDMIRRAAGNYDSSSIQLYRSLAKSYHILTAQLEKNVAQYNLSTSKLRILFWLKMRADDGTDGGGLLPSELSRFHGVTPNTMSALLNSLREAGLIEQTNHPEDRRKRIIRITPTGEALLREIGPGHYEYMRQLFSALSEEERQILITLLQKVMLSVRSRIECEEQEPPHGD